MNDFMTGDIIKYNIGNGFIGMAKVNKVDKMLTGEIAFLTDQGILYDGKVASIVRLNKYRVKDKVFYDGKVNQVEAVKISRSNRIYYHLSEVDYNVNETSIINIEVNPTIVKLENGVLIDHYFVSRYMLNKLANLYRE